MAGRQGTQVAPVIRAEAIPDTAVADIRLRAFAEQIVDEEHDRLRTRYGPPGQHKSEASAITSTPSANLMPSWLRRTGWDGILGGANRRLLVALTKLPSTACRPLRIVDAAGVPAYESPAADEQRLAVIVEAVDWLMDRCHDTVRHTDVSVRRWLRSKYPRQPYKAPFELVTSAHSEKRYRLELKRHLYLHLRLSRLSPAAAGAISGYHTLATSQLLALRALWTDPVWDELVGSRVSYNDGEDNDCSYDEDKEDEAEDGAGDEESESEGGEDGDVDDKWGEGEAEVEGEDVAAAACFLSDEGTPVVREDQRPPCSSRDRAIGIVLRFTYFSTTEEFINGVAGSTLLVYFAAVRGLSATGYQFLYPSQFTPILSRLIYVTRLICLEVRLPRFAHPSVGIAARPQFGQLQRLNETREDKLCDGTLSPMGEFLSLLSYGASLRRCALPSFCFEWGQDGQEISWDGEFRLTMDSFRGLSHSILEAVSQGCQRLMFEWQPDLPDLRTLRDRLSDTSVGYSFVSDSANRLTDEYLLLLKRACLSPVDGLLKIDHRASSSTWDFRSVRAYLVSHDAFLRMLMVLLHTTGGKGSRISELLALEHSNTAHQPRGLSLYRGKLMSITRHHKARVWTNNEFQVARFYPQAVSMLAYQYLVFIRPLTNMLLRKCFGRSPLSSLLFDPASSSTPWTSATFTHELRRLALSLPGIPASIGAQLYRQLSIAIATKHIRAVAESFNRHDDTIASAQQDAVSAWQSGHRLLQQATTYGLDGAYPAHLQPGLLELYERVSGQWHAFLHLDPDRQLEGDPYYSPPSAILSKSNDQPARRSESPPPLAQQKRHYRAVSSDLFPTVTERQPPKRRRLLLASAGAATGQDPGRPHPADYQPLQSNEGSIAIELPQPPTRYQQVNRRVPQAKTSHTQSPFIHLPELHIVICSVCQFAIIGTEALSHLGSPRHKGTFSPREKRLLSERIKALPGIIQTESELRLYELPGPETLPIPFIHPPQLDGIRCLYCRYVCRSMGGIRTHCRSTHGWVNHRLQGGVSLVDAAIQASCPVPWVTGVLCQKLFCNRIGSKWFEVNRIRSTVE